VSISTILDIAIGVSFVYMLLSVIASAITEAISGIFSLRAVTLRRWIERLLKDRTLADKVYAHPLVDGLTEDDDSDPSYISADIFARALVDAIADWKDGEDRAARPSRMGMIRRIAWIGWCALRGFLRRLWPKAEARQANAEKKVATNLAEFKKRLAEAENFDEDTRAALTALVSNSAVETLDDAIARIAQWFDRAMEGCSGWYKRTAHIVISFVALVSSVVLNVDSFVLLDSLGRDAVLRDSVVTAVAESVKSKSNVVTTAEGVADESRATAKATPEEIFTKDERKTEELVRKQVVAIKRGLDELALPLGWPSGKPIFCMSTVEAPCDARAVPPTVSGFLRRFGGWLFTAIAISLGAPFWFSLLNKLINLRAASPPPEKSRPRERSVASESVSTSVRDSLRPSDARVNSSRSDAPPPLS